jgi:hypothetical protein
VLYEVEEVSSEEEEEEEEEKQGERSAVVAENKHLEHAVQPLLPHCLPRALPPASSATSLRFTP